MKRPREQAEVGYFVELVRGWGRWLNVLSEGWRYLNCCRRFSWKLRNFDGWSLEQCLWSSYRLLFAFCQLRVPLVLQTRSLSLECESLQSHCAWESVTFCLQFLVCESWLQLVVVEVQGQTHLHHISSCANKQRCSSETKARVMRCYCCCTSPKALMMHYVPTTTSSFCFWYAQHFLVTSWLPTEPLLNRLYASIAFV